MKQRTLLVGPCNSGKHVIAQALENRPTSLRRVANIVYYDQTIIVPDSYLESPWMHKHVIALQQSAKNGLFLQPVTATRRSYPPNFAKAFRIPILGVVTFFESCEQSALLQAKEQLLACGITEKIICVDLADPQAIKELKKYLQ